MKKSFTKTLSANDAGSTGGHQAGILIPRSNAELLEFLPALDPSIKNPDAWIQCKDETGVFRKFRFVYYNNKLHDQNGTRNEYRITYMTAYFRDFGAREGDILEIARNDIDLHYEIRIVRPSFAIVTQEDNQPHRIKITSGWSRTH